MLSRLLKIRSFLPQLEIGALFLSNPYNIRYFTGYPGEDAWLLITAQKAYYITDFRYIEHARKVLGSHIEVVMFESSIFETAINLALADKVKAFGFEENHLTYYQYKRLEKFSRRKLKLKGLSGAVEALRAVKDPNEIAQIRKAVRINLKAFKFVEPYMRPGLRERDILFKLEDFARKEGVGFAFPPIIASGPNAAYPHARVTDRKLRSGEPVLLDFGVDLGGYKSDLTRMFFLGKMPPSFRKFLDLIRGAQEEAFKKIHSGVVSCEVDAAARQFLAQHDLAQFFGHSLGHGVGMETHEMPRISAKSREVLLENTVITIEPGIYFPGKYGVRLEEMVLITNKGCEVLSGNRDHGSI